MILLNRFKPGLYGSADDTTALLVNPQHIQFIERRGEHCVLVVTGRDYDILVIESIHDIQRRIREAALNE